MRFFFLSVLIFFSLAFTGPINCKSTRQNMGTGFPPTNEGGKGRIDIERNETGSRIRAEFIQPDNPQGPTGLTIETNGVVNVQLPGSNEPTFNAEAFNPLKWGVFIYLGAVLMALGVGLFVARFWFPGFIPVMAGVWVFLGGVAVAAMSKIIPEYAGFGAVLSLFGVVGIFFYRSGLVKPAPLK